MLSQHRASVPLDEPPRKSSLSRFMPFRSSRNNSVSSSINNSPRSSLDVALTDETKPRRLSKPFANSTVSTVRTNSSNFSQSSNGTNKLRKNSSLSPKVTLGDTWERDRVTGEVKDHTNMLHTLAHDFEAPGAGKTPIIENGEPAQPASEFIKTFPPKVWQQIVSCLDLADEASLSLSAKPFRQYCAPDILRQLNDPEKFRARCEVLYRLNYQLPNHLLCYVCGLYHMRTQPGKETLRPTNIANPLFICPYATSNNPAERVSRHRITFGRALPYPFVQLAMRHYHHGQNYGISHDMLSRRYKDKETIGKWSHQTRYAVIDDHLFMRVVSFCFGQPNLPPAGLRHLLYSREDFVPFFSVCAHWRDGELMPSCKCALGHIPSPLEGSGVHRVAKELEARWLKGPQNQIVRLCDNCRPLRRCPECPTEYLIEIRLQEDRAEQDPTKLFKHAIVVTRWSDLGDGSAPWTPEWAAVQGDLDHLPKGERFDSFEVLGRRAISGTFESFFNPEQIPPARLVSLNPDGERLGEKGHRWY